jgi:PIN domain nuclease of toxin-antitoxin system
MLLLDTHLVLWMALAPERLSKPARRLIESRAQALAFSDTTLWEVAIKTSLGRDGFQVDAAALRSGLLAEGLTELAIRPEHLFALGRLPWHHRDPFDRLLVAQAVVEKLTLLSADAALKAYGRFVRVV